jgi:hypothetical protein
MEEPAAEVDIRVGRPIFVVGCPRSGTTMLRHVLDSHPSISCGPETRFLWGLRGLEERNWSTLAGFGMSIDEWHAKVRELFEAPHRHYAQIQGKTRWADKSPDYALMLEYVDALYPESQIIHIVRDPRDVIESWRHFYGTRSLRRAAQSWVRYVRAAHEFARTHLEHRAIEVRYEDIVRDPEQTLRKLFAWLGEPWDDRVLRFEEQRHSLSGGPMKVDAVSGITDIRTSSVGKGHAPYIAAALLVVRKTGRDLLRVFGYS